MTFACRVRYVRITIIDEHPHHSTYVLIRLTHLFYLFSNQYSNTSNLDDLFPTKILISHDVPEAIQSVDGNFEVLEYTPQPRGGADRVLMSIMT